MNMKEMNKTNAVENVQVHQGLSFKTGSLGFDTSGSWLVNANIPQSSFGVLFGKSGSLKSFVAVDLAYSVATGIDWHGRSCDAGTVVYIAAEGQIGLSRRIKALEIKQGIEADNLLVLGEAIFFAENDSRQNFIRALKNIEQEQNTKIKLIIVDTLARCFTGDENTAVAMNAFVKGCDMVCQELDTSILCIHHSGKDDSKGSRGSSVLYAACDYEFLLQRKGSENMATLKNTKQKDADESPKLAFEFEKVDLGIFDDENEPITTLTISSASIIEGDEDINSHPMLKALNEVFNGSCTRDEIRKHCYPEKDGVPANTTCKQFNRAIAKLVDIGAIRIHSKGNKSHALDIISINKPNESSRTDN